MNTNLQPTANCQKLNCLTPGVHLKTCQPPLAANDSQLPHSTHKINFRNLQIIIAESCTLEVQASRGGPRSPDAFRVSRGILHVRPFISVTSCPTHPHPPRRSSFPPTQSALRGPRSACARQTVRRVFPIARPGDPPPPLLNFRFPQNVCRKFDITTATDSVRFNTPVGSNPDRSDCYSKHELDILMND
jgi:hypothetical protein